MLTKSAAQAALSVAMRTGGDYAEIFIEDTHVNTLSMTNDSIDTAVTSREHGAGIRIFAGARSVYVYTNDTSERGLKDAADKAACAIGEAKNAVDVQLTQGIPLNRHAVKLLPSDIPGARKAALMHRAYAAAKSVDEAIAQVIVSLREVDQSVCIVSTEGVKQSDRRVYTRTAIQAIASSGAENQTGFSGPGALMGYELFDARVDIEAHAKEAAETAALMLRAPYCPAGVYPAVIDGGFGGVIFHEACGHSLEASAIAKGSSEFCGKMGQMIASKIVTAIDDGTMPNEWGSENIDDEGIAVGRLILIENGVLKNYMVDRLNGRRLNLPPTGNSRRQNYTFAPTSRMRNTYIAPGQDDDNEMIATMGDGLYAKQMGGGSVNPATGEFNFAVSEGYWVKDGKITHPVRGATLIGKGGEALLRIDRVGKHMTLAQGMCGAMSGSVPTSVGQPRIRISSLTVGGR